MSPVHFAHQLQRANGGEIMIEISSCTLKFAIYFTIYIYIATDAFTGLATGGEAG